jgi:hypothetical protein
MYITKHKFMGLKVGWFGIIRYICLGWISVCWFKED